MSWTFYCDESGHDGKNAPHVVVGGFGLHSFKQNEFFEEILRLYFEAFGVNHTLETDLKGSHLLHKKKILWASYYNGFSHKKRRYHSERFLASGSQNIILTREDYAGYGQACVYFVVKALSILREYDGHIIAVIGDKNKLKTYETGAFAYVSSLEQRFVTNIIDFINEYKTSGKLIFDTYEERADTLKIKSYLEIANNNHNWEYGDFTFEMTSSHKSLGIQIADIVIYILNHSMPLKDVSGFNETTSKISQIQEKAMFNNHLTFL